MNKKTVFLMIIGMVFSVSAFCQAAQTNTNPNAERDRMYRIVNASTTTEVPPSLISELKSLARTKGINENAVLRNTILLKPLYNSSLTKEDRLFAANVLMQMSENAGSTIPADAVRKAISEISKN